MTISSNLQPKTKFLNANAIRVEKLILLGDSELSRLRIQFEKYFSGVEKRAPYQEKEELQLQLRRLVSEHITQTSLKFRAQQLNARFQTYNTLWERILRQIDDGTFKRSRAHAARATQVIATPASAKKTEEVKFLTAEDNVSDVERIHSQYEAISAENGYMTPVPSRKQLEILLKKQEVQIKKAFGEKKVDYYVTLENGSPTLKARAQKDN